MNEKEFIKKHATLELKKEFIKELEKIWKAIDTGSLDYNKCDCCSKMINDWMKVRKIIKNKICEWENV